MDNLQKIDLDIEIMKDDDFVSFENLYENLKNLKNLENVQLNLYKNYKIIFDYSNLFQIMQKISQNSFYENFNKSKPVIFYIKYYS